LHANLANMAETKTWYGEGTERVLLGSCLSLTCNQPLVGGNLF